MGLICPADREGVSKVFCSRSLRAFLGFGVVFMDFMGLYVALWCCIWPNRGCMWFFSGFLEAKETLIMTWRLGLGVCSYSRSRGLSKFLGRASRFLVSETTALAGSWVVVSGVISKVTRIMTQIRGLITPLITTHEPPSMVGSLQGFYFVCDEVFLGISAADAAACDST